MTIEILYLTEQIHRWLNARVAHHLAAQAGRLMSARQIAQRTLGTDEAEGMARVPRAEMAGIACAAPRDAAAGSRCPAAQTSMLDSEKHRVRA
jgi:hypothetical protein